MSSPLHSFRSQLLVAMLGLALASVAVTGAVSWYYSARTLDGYAETVAQQALRRAEARVAEVVRAAVELNEFAVGTLERAGTRPADLPGELAFLARYFEERRELTYLGIAFEETGEYGMLERLDGGAVQMRFYRLKEDGEREIQVYRIKDSALELARTDAWDGYDPRKRPYYEQAWRSDRAGWTESYFFAGSDVRVSLLGVSYVAPFRDRAGRRVGVVDTDFDVKALSGYLDGLRREMPGRAFVVEERADGQKRLLAHPAFASLPALTDARVATATDEVVNGLLKGWRGPLRELHAQEGQMRKFTAGGTEHLGGVFLPRGRNAPPWMIAIELQREEVGLDLLGERRAAVAVGAAGAMLAVLLAAWLAAKVSRPLLRLEREAEGLAEDGAGEPVRPSGPGELQRLAAAFNRMAERVRARQILLAATNSSLRQEIASREQVEAQLRDGAGRLRAANEVLYRLAASVNLREGRLRPALAEITEGCVRGLGVTRASVWLKSGDEDRMVLADLFDGAKSEHSAGAELELSRHARYAAAIAGERCVAATTARTDPRTSEFTESYLAPAGIFSLLDAGIRSRGALVGVVCIEQTGAPRTWTPEEEAFAGSVSDLASLVVEAAARVTAEHETAQSRERVRLLIEGTPLAAIDWDRDFRIIGWNPAAEKIFGWPRAEVIGQDGWMLTTPEVRQSEPDIWRRLAEGRAASVVHSENLTRDGRAIICNWSNTVLRDTRGRLIGATSLVEDVTARVQAEEEVRALNATLERRVADRTAALAAANDQLKELDRLKSEFLATMSHELRTPLNAIIGFTGIVKQGMAGAVNPEQKKQLEMVYASAKHLLGLINDVLDLSRIESGRMALEVTEFSPGDVVAEVARTLAPMVALKGLAFQLDAPAGLPRLRGDRKKFFQVVLNLANNAVKFTERGEVRVRLAARAGGGVEVAVSDTGPGIRADQRPLLFEAFRQLDGSARRVYEGTGLGLYLCKKICALLGGGIEVESEPGCGSCFTFWVPAEPPRAVAAGDAAKKP